MFSLGRVSTGTSSDSNNTDNYFNIMVWWKLISAKAQVVFN